MAGWMDRGPLWAKEGWTIGSKDKLSDPGGRKDVLNSSSIHPAGLSCS